ncbi:MAG: TetR/AcrR family transcriptional regulator [Gammaproteobacteria bacterium]
MTKRGSRAGAGHGARAVRAEQTRRTLVLAALDEFSRRPFDRVAIDDVAAAAGVAHGLVFHYFGSKRGLYLEALREVARQLRAIHADSGTGAAGERIRAMLLRHLRYMSRHSALARHLFRGGLGTDPEAWNIIDASRAEATTWIARELGLDPGNPALKLTLRAMSGAIDEATVYWLDHRRLASLVSMTDALLEMVAAAVTAAARLDEGLDVAPALSALGGPKMASR